jgi:hypothetical protein
MVRGRLAVRPLHGAADPVYGTRPRLYVAAASLYSARPRLYIAPVPLYSARASLYVAMTPLGRVLAQCWWWGLGVIGLLPFFPCVTILHMAHYRVKLLVNQAECDRATALVRKADALSPEVLEGVLKILNGAISFVQLPLPAPEPVAL